MLIKQIRLKPNNRYSGTGTFTIDAGQGSSVTEHYHFKFEVDKSGGIENVEIGGGMPGLFIPELGELEIVELRDENKSTLVISNGIINNKAGNAMDIKLKHKRTGLRLPTKINGWICDSDAEYHGSKLGVSITYQYNHDITATIFVYNYSMSNIGNGIKSDSLRHHYAVMKKEILNFNHMPGAPYTVSGRMNDSIIRVWKFLYPTKFLCCTYTIKWSGDQEIEEGTKIFITGFHNFFLKVRVSYSISNANKCEKAVKLLLRGIIS